MPPVSDCQKTYGWHRRARKPFDSTSKIGDMCGDFSRFSARKSFLTRGNGRERSDQ